MNYMGSLHILQGLRERGSHIREIVDDDPGDDRRQDQDDLIAAFLDGRAAPTGGCRMNHACILTEVLLQFYQNFTSFHNYEFSANL